MIKVASKVSTEDEEHIILKGNDVTFKGDRFFYLVPDIGEICLIVDGKNTKGKVILLKTDKFRF